MTALMTPIVETGSHCFIGQYRSPGTKLFTKLMERSSMSFKTANMRKQSTCVWLPCSGRRRTQEDALRYQSRAQDVLCFLISDGVGAENRAHRIEQISIMETYGVITASRSGAALSSRLGRLERDLDPI